VQVLGRPPAGVEVLEGAPVALGGPRGLEVTRTLPNKHRRMVGAWCFLDAYGPQRLDGSPGMRVGPHPHIGLQTVSWLVAGEIVHRDSLGSLQEVRPGQQIGRISATRREVTVDLDATRQSLARAGGKVTVELPTGRTARGRVTDVGKVAEPPSEEGGDATIPVTIALRGKAARGSGLDQAPVDVGFEVERAEDVLTVPIKALLARQGGGFAVQLAGSGRIVPVEPGLYADDLVEVEGELEVGDTVVTAR